MGGEGSPVGGKAGEQALNSGDEPGQGRNRDRGAAGSGSRRITSPALSGRFSTSPGRREFFQRMQNLEQKSVPRLQFAANVRHSEQPNDLPKENKSMNISKSSLVAAVLVTTSLLLSACAPKVGSDEWCAAMKNKPKGDLSANEVTDFAKHCILK